MMGKGSTSLQRRACLFLRQADLMRSKNKLTQPNSCATFYSVLESELVQVRPARPFLMTPEEYDNTNWTPLMAVFRGKVYPVVDSGPTDRLVGLACVIDHEFVYWAKCAEVELVDWTIQTDSN